MNAKEKKFIATVQNYYSEYDKKIIQFIEEHIIYRTKELEEYYLKNLR